MDMDVSDCVCVTCWQGDYLHMPDRPHWIVGKSGNPGTRFGKIFKIQKNTPKRHDRPHWQWPPIHVITLTFTLCLTKLESILTISVKLKMPMLQQHNDTAWNSCCLSNILRMCSIPHTIVCTFVWCVLSGFQYIVVCSV